MKSRDECEFWSLNSRLDALQAAILNIKLPRLSGWNKRRREIANQYIRQLESLVKVPRDTDKESSVYHTFIIQTARRDELQAFLTEAGIGTKVHYPLPIHRQEAASEIASANDNYPETDRQVKEILSLPVYPELTNAQVEYVCDRIKAFFKAS
jgi:dTDP-4-amino-4,6-dideoxygalactose transaminase